jgi:hypothetical protein
VIATYEFDGGGSLQLALVDQTFNGLTSDEVKLVSEAAVLLKRRKPPRRATNVGSESGEREGDSRQADRHLGTSL